MVECKELHVAFATDDRYLKVTLVAAMSALVTCSRPGDLVFDILDCGISDGDWIWFKKYLGERYSFGQRIIRHKINLDCFKGAKPWRNSYGNYARILLPQVIDVPLCIYADGDVMFFDDVFKLTALNDNETAIWGWNCEHWECPPLQEYFANHGIELDHDKYFCSGFLLMNLDLMRELNVVEHCVRYLVDNPESIYPDQDALYVACYGHISRLPKMWGAFNSLGFIDGELPSAVHFAFGKPWLFGDSRWHCLNDLDMLWLSAAKALCGYSYHDFGRTTYEFVLRRGLNVIRNILVSICSCSSCGREKFIHFKRFNFPGTRNKFKGFWAKRLAYNKEFAQRIG